MAAKKEHDYEAEERQASLEYTFLEIFKSTWTTLVLVIAGGFALMLGLGILGFSIGYFPAVLLVLCARFTHRGITMSYDRSLSIAESRKARYAVSRLTK